MYGLIKILYGSLVLAQFVVSVTTIVISIDKIRVYLDSLIEVCYSLCILPSFE